MKYTYIYMIGSILIACQPSKTELSEDEWISWEEEPLSEGYEITSAQESINLTQPNEFELELLEVQKSLKENSEDIVEMFGADTISPDIYQAFLQTKGRKVNLAEEIGMVFNPKFFSCPLPERIEKKLIRKGGFIPPEVNAFIEDIKGQVTKYERTSLSAFLHTVDIKIGEISSRWPILSVPTMSNFEFSKFLVAKGQASDNFMYNLDCSGYLNASISGSGRLPLFQIKGKAESALKEQGSLFVAGGTVVSPIAVAYHGSIIGGVNMDNSVRIKVLEQILEVPGIQDNSIVSFSNSYDVVFASNQGKSSLNGNGKIEASSSANVGPASFRAGANAGGNLTRSSSFSSYDVYVSDRQFIPNSAPFTITQLKQRIKDLKKDRTNEEAVVSNF